MEMIAVILIVWLVITILGHGTWVILARIFRGLPNNTGDSELEKETPDLAAAHRVVQRLAEKRLLGDDQLDQWRASLRDLERGVDRRVGEPSSPPKTSDDDDEVLVAQLVDPPRPHPLDAEPSFGSPLAEVGKQPFASEPAINEPASVQAEPVAPALSVSGLVQSFLDRRNIRWGELAAGMLIVICSIGLVISLWSPLVKQHGVVPSLIFLAANAAIYAAGFYTLGRWKVRHTSRAVLVIATLLVPLSVSAGMAAAGQSADSVQLNDPITLIAIAVAGAIYSWLVYRGGVALVRRKLAASLTMAVAGPVAILPVLPAAVRSLGSQAGWVVLVGGITVAVAILWANRRGGLRPSAALGIASWGTASTRARGWISILGIFALLVTVVAAAFALRDADSIGNNGTTPWLSIAIGALPAIAALGAAGRQTMRRARSGSQSMAGAVVCVVSIGFSLAMLPPMMVAGSWLWAWGVVLAVTCLVAAWVLGLPSWQAVATIPMGAAATLSSPTWLGNQGWDQVGWMPRLLGGEPMAATVAVTCVCGVVAWMTRRTSVGGAWRWAAAGWGMVATALAMGLSVSPMSTLGGVGALAVTAWLSAVTIFLCIASNRVTDQSVPDRFVPDRFVSAKGIALLAGLASLFAWLSWLRPIEMDFASFDLIHWGTISNWMTLTAATSVTWIVMGECQRWWERRKSSQTVSGAISCERQEWRSTTFWNLAFPTATALAVMACFGVREESGFAIGMLAAATAMLVWASVAMRWIGGLRIAQVASLALAIASIHVGLPQRLVSSLWTWSWMLAAIGLTWAMLRVAAGHLATRWQSRTGGQRISFFSTSDGFGRWMTDGGLGLGLAASLGSLAFVQAAVWGLGWTPTDETISDPLLAIGLGAAGVGLGWWTGKDRRWLSLSAVACGASMLVWFSVWVTAGWEVTAVTRLVAVTSFVGAVMIAVGQRSRWGMGGAVGLVSLSTVTLLVNGWFEPFLRLGVTSSIVVDPVATLASSTWWILIGGATLVSERRVGNRASSLAVAASVPAALFFATPAIIASPPALWLQVAALAAAVWAGVIRGRAEPSAEGAAVKSLWIFTASIGFLSALAAIVSVLFHGQVFQSTIGVTGFLVSAVATVFLSSSRLRIWLTGGVGGFGMTWPIGIGLMAGQVAGVAFALGWVSPRTTGLLMIAWWVVSAFGSVVHAVMNRHRKIGLINFDGWHVAIVAVGVPMLVASATLPSWSVWLSLASLVAAGAWVGVAQRWKISGARVCFHSRLLGWWVIGAGGWILVNWIDPLIGEFQAATWLLGWGVAWWLVWTFARIGQDGSDQERVVTPSRGLLGWFHLLLLWECAAAVVWGGLVDGGSVADPLTWFRLVLYAIVFATPWFATFAWPGKTVCHVAETGMIGVGIVASMAAWIAVQFGVSLMVRWMVAVVSAGFVVALVSHWLPLLASGLSSRGGQMRNGNPRAMIQAALVNQTKRSAWLIVGLAVAGACLATADGEPKWIRQMLIAAVAMAAWAMAVIGKRRTAVVVAMLTTGLWAVLVADPSVHPALEATMRGLVASVLTIPIWIFGAPAMLGQRISRRWSSAFRWGAIIGASAATVSLVTMLGLELAVRSGDGIDGVSRVTVVMVALTLATLSGLAGLVAVLGFRGAEGDKPSSIAARLNCSDGTRQFLVLASQAIGGITWFHLFLCKSPLALTGLRPYWPFVVMTLAFLSVGLTEWARRRGDEVIARTMKQTSLYLPLVPVIGFWLSGFWFGDGSVSGEGFDAGGWSFRGGKVGYEWMLILGAIYYTGISTIWKQTQSRVAAVLLGNAAWWVILVQQPGWAFLTHPQAWLIPPAACVLAISHVYRNRIEATLLATIRYAAMLVIYISSTADMILSEIGSNLSGPIVLVMLALTGMLVGVVLRIRPFLHLGALFVFLGVASMVRYAQLSFDAVWPWWVFGITTGVLLLVGLTLLEKNKSRLRRATGSGGSTG